MINKVSSIFLILSSERKLHRDFLLIIIWKIQLAREDEDTDLSPTNLEEDENILE